MAKAVRKGSKKTPKPGLRFRFHYTTTYDAVLDEEQIWPDGDMPVNPTDEDALATLIGYADDNFGGNLYHTLSEWNMIDEDSEVSVEVEVTRLPMPTPNARKERYDN